VTYVWFDALVNYISFAGYLRDEAAFKDHWPALHVIGKDILIPAHGIYWLVMLKAMGFADNDMPSFLVHGYVLVDGDKMSKSLGNIRDPNTFADTFGVEALRYYLMRDCVVGQDMDFTDERLIQRYNSDLANGLGNLLNRTLSMAHRYRAGKLRKFESADGCWQTVLGPSTPVEDLHLGVLRSEVEKYCEAMERNQIHLGLHAALQVVQHCNSGIEIWAPWKLAKDPDKAEALDAALYYLAESLRVVAILICPVLPRATRAIFEQLNLQGKPRLKDTAWGGLPEGHLLGRPTPVFPRIETLEKAVS
jgi:methionyl-tRNA synthetase